MRKHLLDPLHPLHVHKMTLHVTAPGLLLLKTCWGKLRQGAGECVWVFPPFYFFSLGVISRIPSLALHTCCP